MFNLFCKVFVATLNLIRLTCLMRLCKNLTDFIEIQNGIKL